MRKLQVMLKLFLMLLFCSNAFAGGHVDGDFYVTGNTGLGSTSPSQKLDVNGSAKISDSISTDGGDISSDGIGNLNVNALLTTNTFSSQNINDDNSLTGILELGDYNNVHVHNTFFTVDPVKNIFYFSNSNVGIGTTIPGQKLEVKGIIRSLGEDIIGNVGIGTTIATPATLTLGKTSSNNGLLTVNGLSVFNSTVTVNGSFVIDALNGIEDLNAYLLYGPQTPSGNDGEVDLGDPNEAYNGIKIVIDQTNSNIQLSNNVGIGSTTPGQKLDVQGTIRGTNIIDTGVTASTYGYFNASKQLASATLGAGLNNSSGTLSSNAVSFVTYQPGLLTAVNATIGVNYKFSKANTVDNIVGSAVTFSCIANPTVTMYECGTSTTCTSPTTIGTVTVTAAGTAVAGTVSNAAITAGDYIGWAITAGTCASIDIAATAQVHSN